MSRTFTIDFATSSKGVITEDRELTDTEIAASGDGADTQKRIKREERNQLLSETDWWATSDRTMSDAQKNYRQHLRDVTGQSGFPDTVDWGTKPD